MYMSRLDSTRTKGQAEFFAILGILVVVVVVAYYSMQSPGPPPTQQIAEQVRMTQSSVENFIRSGVQDTLKKLSDNGGHLQLPADTVRFMQQDIPYWSYNGKTSIPDVRANFITGLADYLKNNRAGFASALGNVTISDPAVSATVFDSRIDLAITMPTTVAGYSIPQPYKLSIPTKIGEIADFGRNFADGQARNRYFEVFTLSSMLLSPLEDGVQTTPISIFLSECGDFVYRGWDDIKPNMEFQIKITLANTYMPGKSPMNTYETSPNPKYALPTFSGKRYEDINVSFFLPDNFELDRASFSFTPEPVIVLAEPIPLTGSCVSKANYIKYYLNYPVITRIKDTLTGNIFQFAFNVYIKDNKAGQFTDMLSYSTGTDICAYKLCSAKVAVKDLAGNPVPAAAVSYMGCEIGKTNANGIAEGAAVCGAGDLTVNRAGYSYVTVPSSLDKLNTTVTLPRKPLANMYFHLVNVQNLSGTYFIGPDDIKWLGDREEMGEKQGDVVQMVFFNLDGVRCDNDVCLRIYKAKSGQLKNVPAGSYAISAALTSGNFITTYGSVATDSYTIKEDYGMAEGLHVYVPYNPVDFANANDNIVFMDKTAVYTNVLNSCGIPVVSDRPVEDFKGCSVKV
jgi:hypothetical protein